MKNSILTDDHKFQIQELYPYYSIEDIIEILDLDFSKNSITDYRNSIIYYCKSLGLKKDYYEINESIFDNINDEVNSYILGVFLGLGRLDIKGNDYYIYFDVSLEDYDILEQLAEVLELQSKLFIRPNKFSCFLYLKSKVLYFKLEEFRAGLSLSSLNKDNFFHFVRGLIDVSGYLNEGVKILGRLAQYPSAKIYLLDKTLAKEISYRLSDYKIKNTVSTDNNADIIMMSDESLEIISIHNDSMSAFIESIYIGSEIYSYRKYSIARVILNNLYFKTNASATY